MPPSFSYNSAFFPEKSVAKVDHVKFRISFAGQRDFDKRIQRSRSEMPRDSMWRRSWSIPRSDGIVSHRRKVTRHQLFVYGRLRRSWLLFSRNRHLIGDPKGTKLHNSRLLKNSTKINFFLGAISGKNHDSSRQP